MTIFQIILMGLLIVCAVSVSFSKNLLNSILIYMSFSLVMSMLWICLESPDLAITEAAAGAGITSVLFFVTLKKFTPSTLPSLKQRRKRKMSRKKTAEEYQKTFALTCSFSLAFRRKRPLHRGNGDASAEGVPA